MSCRVNLFNKQVGLGLRTLDTFTKIVGFGSTHIAEYIWLNTTRTQPTNMNCRPYLIEPNINALFLSESCLIKIVNVHYSESKQFHVTNIPRMARGEKQKFMSH